MPKKLQTRRDIKCLVDKFYEQVVKDSLLGPIFNDVAKVDWDTHLPKMYNFWESILLGSSQYEGNPMEKHIQLSQKTPLSPAHFNRWLTLFYETVENNFEGEKAREAKIRAQSIAKIMEYKVNQN